MGTLKDDEGFGCRAFGHLASPFVDGELPREDQARFATHLDACRPCQRLTGEYRALDRAASAPAPEVTEPDWQRAWGAVRDAIAADRAEAERSPLSGVRRLLGGAWPPPAPLRVLAYAAAAVALAALLLTVQRHADGGRPTGVVVHRAGPAAGPLSVAAPTAVLAATCQSPEYMPVVYTTGGDDPLTVIQCALVGADS